MNHIDTEMHASTPRMRRFLRHLGEASENLNQNKRIEKRKKFVEKIGSLTEEPSMTAFPNDDKYDGIVIQTGIPVVSLCAHHNLPFTGYATVAYVPKEKVVGLSKLNRVVEGHRTHSLAGRRSGREAAI